MLINVSIITLFTELSDRKSAYGIEQVRIEMNGGARNAARNYNRKNSPGLKILKSIFK